MGQVLHGSARTTEAVRRAVRWLGLFEQQIGFS